LVLWNGGKNLSSSGISATELNERFEKVCSVALEEDFKEVSSKKPIQSSKGDEELSLVSSLGSLSLNDSNLEKEREEKFSSSSSSSVAICSICFDEVDDNYYTITGCNHKFCKQVSFPFIYYYIVVVQVVVPCNILTRYVDITFSHTNIYET